MSRYLLFPHVIMRIKHAMKHKRALSLVRIGDGENIVLAQNSVWPIKKVMRVPWAIQSTRGNDKGVHLPNIRLRNEVIRSIRKATIVGILPPNDRIIRARHYLKRPLTNRVFKYFKLKPRLLCHACVNRMMPHRRMFWNMLKGKRILIINRNPRSIKSILERHPYNLNVTGTIPFSHYRQMNRALRKIRRLKHTFDIALISCGVNAVILAPKIAESTGKVAIDFGKAPKEIRKRK